MKKAFSTLGCPTWSFNEIVSVAKDIGMNGIEIRGLGYQMYAPALSIFSERNIDKTISVLKRTGIEIPMLTTSCDLSVSDFENCLNEANDYINLAKKIGTPYIRIMCQNSAKPGKDIDIDLIAKRYKEICNIAKDTTVTPLIETNSHLANSDKMLEFLAKADCENMGVLWDFHHPYRFFNESIEYTFNNLSKYIKYVHFKDSVMKDDGKVEY
ncbi:MAG: TIM barrel protein, partial [Clostridia bacterium]|nr:TIM barrel protein [Clostridia bacterium]